MGADTVLTCLSQNALAPCEDFLLFTVLFEATVINPVMATQPISFEISIGVRPNQSPKGSGFEGGHSSSRLRLQLTFSKGWALT